MTGTGKKGQAGEQNREEDKTEQEEQQTWGTHLVDHAKSV
jgi:hypothetical protein